MPIRTGLVRAVDSQVLYRAPSPRADRVPVGTRYNVALGEEGFSGFVPLYTTDALRASLCLGAKQQGRAVIVGTRQSRWGEEIITVELAEKVEAAL